MTLFFPVLLQLANGLNVECINNGREKLWVRKRIGEGFTFEWIIPLKQPKLSGPTGELNYGVMIYCVQIYIAVTLSCKIKAKAWFRFSAILQKTNLRLRFNFMYTYQLGIKNFTNVCEFICPCAIHSHSIFYFRIMLQKLSKMVMQQYFWLFPDLFKTYLV